MNTCVEEKLGSQSVHKVSEDVVQDFHRRIPYNYLQLAYQKVGGWESWVWGGGISSTLTATELPMLLPGNVMRSDVNV